MSYFISSHGFGHAARACAVMDALHRIHPDICFHIYTTVPRWFFEESLAGPYTYTSILTDVGLVQHTPFVADLPSTLKRLDDLLPFEDNLIERLAGMIKQCQCRLILCDIAPMGIEVGRAAGIPSILVENFTWDWVYQGLYSEADKIDIHIAYLKQIFARATYHIQTEPVCGDLIADLRTNPVSRKPRIPTAIVRKRLGVPEEASLIMLTLGGITSHNGLKSRFPLSDNLYFVVLGEVGAVSISKNIIRLPHRSAFYHPDLIQACDAVIGKVGYSTLAEVYHAGRPFGYIPHPQFRESEVLEAFIVEQMKGFPVEANQLESGVAEDMVKDLISLPQMKRNGSNGADQIARYVVRML